MAVALRIHPPYVSFNGEFREGSIRRISGQVVYDIKKSQTDLLIIQLGVAFRF